MCCSLYTMLVHLFCAVFALHGIRGGRVSKTPGLNSFLELSNVFSNKKRCYNIVCTPGNPSRCDHIPQSLLATTSHTTTGCGTAGRNHPAAQTTRPMNPPQPQPPHRPCSSSGAAGQVQQLRCSSSGAAAQVQQLRCSSSGAAAQVQQLRCSSSGAAAQVQQLRCSSSGAA